MMTPIFLFFLLSSIFTVEAQQGQSIVKPGSILIPNTSSSWLSPSGLYAFGFYKQGNGYAVGVFLAGIPQPQKTVVWTANRDNPPVSDQVILNFTGDGRLVLQSARGAETSVADFSSASSASMLDTGNFVVYNSDNQSIWESFQNPTDTLLPTQRLLPNDSVVLKSSVSESNQSTGRFRAIMQQDGYVALYPVGTNLTMKYGYWSTSTNVTNGSLNLNDQGFLYVTNGNFTWPIFQSRNFPNGTLLYRLRMEDDGFLRLYSYNLQEQNGSWSIIWSPLSQPDVNICTPRGLCGVNAFCVPAGNDINCTCLPGFVFIDESKRTLGCERNSITENCDEKGMNTTMEEVPDIIWENVAYSQSLLSTKQDCDDACLQDCRCEAALFNGSVCGKQNLPLRFVNSKIPIDSKATLAFIKVRTPTPSSDGTVTKKKGLDILIIIVSLVAFAFIVLAISGIAIYRSCIFTNENILNTGNIVLSDEDVGPRSFTYIELEKITDGFKEELGRGSFGIVYKGTIENGQKIVAVKRLERLLVDREREFQTEMKVIGRIHHKNLIRLLGYCHDGPNRLLVYEYMCNGSLADVLFKPEKKPSWVERMEIACNIARGILYLHEECIEKIIHCDIKPQNILMDENRFAKISDFGLAKLLKPDQSKTSIDLRGTRGYVAPEFHQLIKCPATVKVDVYSFGIVLLEIISCRRCLDINLPEEEIVLAEWSYKCFECGELGKLLNDEEVEMRQLERMVKVALWCILYDPSLRPSMKKVLQMLEGTADIPIPPNSSSISQYDQGFGENK